MKFLAIIISCFLIIGCGLVEIKPAGETLILKTTARTLGYNIAKKDPGMIYHMRAVCNAMLQVENSDMQPLVDLAMKYILDNYGMDPLMKANVHDLMTMVKINADINYENVRIAAGAFLEGVDLCPGG